MLPTTTAADVYTDFKGLAELKRQARSDSPQAVRNAAKQFEAVFLQMMLKSMRDAGPANGLLDNEQTRFYRDMHDKQLSLQLADHTGTGLAKLLTEQLGEGSQTAQNKTSKKLDFYRQNPVVRSYSNVREEEGSPEKSVNLSETTKVLKKSPERPINHKEEFVERILPFARQAGEELGVAPGVLIAQAALETGWGRSLLPRANGENSHNLFNIKANGRWKGERATVTALEFEDGVMQKKRASFRAYRDFEESFHDYVDLLKNSPRYENALKNVHDPRAYISALRDAGYATDPHYADKVMRIFDQIELVVADADHGARPEV